MAVIQQRTSGLSSPPTFVLSADTIRIGRQADCELLLDSQDVSRYHAQIFRRNGLFFVEDLQSRNGTTVNGSRLTEPVVLSDGDEIGISSLIFVFLTEDPALDDSSPSGYTPSVITLSGTYEDSPASRDPVSVDSGDYLSYHMLGLHPLDANGVVARVSVGEPEGNWPTMQRTEEKLLRSLRLQHHMRSAVTQDEVLQATLHGLFELHPVAERIAIILTRDQSAGFVVAAAASRIADDVIQLCAPALHSVMESGDALFYAERCSQDTNDEDTSDDLVMSYNLCTTLIGTDRNVLGAIQIETRKPAGFEPHQAEELAILSHTIAGRLDTAAATEMYTRKAVLTRSVQAADTLRRHLVPPREPSVKGFRFGHQVITVPEVAADLVDYVRLPDGRQACFILDVPGRGSEAAGLMAAMAKLVTQALVASASPAEAIRCVEEDLRERMSEIPMVTSVCAAILDPRRSAVTISVAGHCPVYHFRRDRVSALSEADFSGPPLGAPREAYLETELHLDSDDVLLLCSDGIARLPVFDDQEPPQKRILSLLRRAAAGDRAELEKRIISEVKNLCAGSEPDDDVVLVAIHKQRQSPTFSGLSNPFDTQVIS